MRLFSVFKEKQALAEQIIRLKAAVGARDETISRLNAELLAFTQQADYEVEVEGGHDKMVIHARHISTDQNGNIIMRTSDEISWYNIIAAVIPKGSIVVRLDCKKPAKEAV